jgi:transposase
VKRVYYVGIDIGKKRCAAYVTNDNGQVQRELIYRNTRTGITELAETLALHGECTAVVESTGNLWLKTYEVLEDNGVPVKLANPLKTRAIAEAKIKTDKISARILAHLLRADLIPECYIPPREVRERRDLLRHRTALIRARTVARNQVHNILDKYDKECGYKDMFCKAGMKWLETLELQGVDQKILGSHVRHLHELDSEIGYVDSLIASEALKDDDVALLLTLTGVSYFGALLLVSEIGDISRFSSPKKLVSWAGLCPTLHQSGEMVKYGRLKKAGNRHIRWIMVQAATIASQHDPELRRLYLKTRSRQGHQKAVVRVANKMLRVIWCMLTKKEPYRYSKEGLLRAKLKRMERVAISGRA